MCIMPILFLPLLCLIFTHIPYVVVLDFLPER